MQRHVSIPLIFSILLISVVGVSFAEPWLCGTPLLIQDDNRPVPAAALATNVMPASRHQHAVSAAPIQLGQVDEFFIHIPEMAVKASCVAIGRHIYVYIENSVRDIFTRADAIAIAAEFDTRIYPKVREWMGSEARPGLDRDNRITLLMHDVGMNQSSLDYGGYFAPVDQIPTASNSNRREILFMDIYQFRERTRRTFYSSLSHEFAHLVNWYQNGGTTDERWLEEGVASFIEWAVYGNVHTLFVDGYLTAPNVPLAYANTPDVYYGGAFLLLLYLYEQYGGAALIRAIIEEDALGIHAIENALSSTGTTERFVDVFLKWGLANWFNNRVRSKQLGYQNLQNRKVTATIQRINRYPTTAGNIRIANWGAYYLLFQNPPRTLDITLTGETPEAEHAHLYAATLTLTLNGPPAITPFQFDAQNSGRTRLENLPRGSQLLLIATADTPQTLRYSAGTQINGAQNFEPQLPIKRQPMASQTIPKTITYAHGNQTQPSIKKTNISYILEPMTQLHLASDYQDVLVHRVENGEPYLYATSDWGLEIFALTELGKPRRIGEIATPGKAQTVVIDANIAYVADGRNGVQLIALNPPTAPKIIKTVGGFADARHVTVADKNIYVLDSERGLLVFNGHDTRNTPRLRPRRFFRTAGTPINVVIKDDTVYLSDMAQGLYILASNPFGNFVIRSVIPVLVHDFKTDGLYGYIAGGNLRVVELTNPEEPEILSDLKTPGSATGVHVHNQHVYLTDRQSGLHIIDARNPERLRRISSQPTSGTANDIAYWNDTVYIADGKGGIQTIDVSTSHAPIWTNRYAASGTVYGLDVVEGEHRAAYIANGVDGIKTVEFTSAHDGTVTHTFPMPSPAMTIRVRNNLGFVATEAGMFIIDVVGSTILSHIPTAAPVTDIALTDRYAYLCAGSLNIVDIGIPQQSRLISQRTVLGSAYRVTLSPENAAYVAALEGGMHIFDTTHPASPKHIATYATQGNATGVALASESGRAYLLDSRVGVIVLDVTEPNKSQQVEQYVIDTLPIQAQIQGDYLYLLDTAGMQIVDTRTLTAITRFNQLRFPYEFKLVEDTLYIADLYQLRIFQVHPRRFGLAVELTEEPRANPQHEPQSDIQNLTNRLGQNFPNPFNSETWIPYQLAASASVTLSIYDTQGRSVYVDVIGNQRQGAYTAYWDGRNTTGEPVASGVYFYFIEAGNFRATRKMFIQR